MRRSDFPSQLLRLAAALSWLALLVLPPAHSQTPSGKDLSFNPYAADVRRAIAPAPGEAAPRLTEGAGKESPACRQLRMRMERLREAPPQAELPAAGYAGARRPTVGPQPGAPSSDLQSLELRYQNECR